MNLTDDNLQSKGGLLGHSEPKSESMRGRARPHSVLRSEAAITAMILRARRAVVLNTANALYAFNMNGSSVPAALIALAGPSVAQFLRENGIGPAYGRGALLDGGLA